jgi:hypothetical protein
MSSFPEDILYILASENNDTGLSAKRARELTDTILLQLRVALARVCRKELLAHIYEQHPELFATGTYWWAQPPEGLSLMIYQALHDALSLDRRMDEEPRHDWEPRLTFSSWEHLLTYSRELARERDDALRRAEQCAKLLLEAQHPGLLTPLTEEGGDANAT